MYLPRSAAPSRDYCAELLCTGCCLSPAKKDAVGHMLAQTAEIHMHIGTASPSMKPDLGSGLRLHLMYPSRIAEPSRPL